MTPEKQKALIGKKSRQCKELISKIDELTEKRSKFIKQTLEEQGGAKDRWMSKYTLPCAHKPLSKV